MGKYLNFYWENPLKTYNKVKTVFKPLKRKWQFWYGKQYNNAKILDITAFDVIWKMKYDDPRHEYNPRIEVSIFNRLNFRINFVVDDTADVADESYWEAILTWMYCGKTLAEAIGESTGWTKYDKETDSYAPIKYHYLKEPYQTYYENGQLPSTLFIKK